MSTKSAQSSFAGAPPPTARRVASEGSRIFDELASGTYQVTETQPKALIDGTDSTDMSDVIVEDDQFTNIVLSGGQEFIENNFGEASIHPSFVSITFFFASSASIQDEVFREIVAAGEENAGNMDLAASIRATSPCASAGTTN